LGCGESRPIACIEQKTKEFALCTHSIEQQCHVFVKPVSAKSISKALREREL
jgi:hypothetical protein